jgi:hypothetical protein
MGTLYVHYNNNEAYKNVGTYTGDSVMSIVLDADSKAVTWYKDDVEMWTTTATPNYPLNVFATIHNKETTCPETLSAVGLSKVIGV